MHSRILRIFGQSLGKPVRQCFVAKKVINIPFIVINADDYHGKEGFKEFFKTEVQENPLKAEYLIPIFIGNC